MQTWRRIAILAAVGVASAAPPASASAGASIFFDDGAFAIGWAPANGTGAKRRLVETKHPWAVAANRTYVYWARRYCCGGKTQFIGRARQDGSQARQAFITIPGLSRAQGGIDSVAVDAQHVYWTNGNVIGRANLDGSSVQPAFVTFPENT